MTHRPISAVLLFVQVSAVWALILAALVFSRWNGRDDQGLAILAFGAGAIVVPAYQLVMRALDVRRQAKCLIAPDGVSQLQSGGTSGATELAQSDGAGEGRAN